jgi:hypothetical protein
VAEKEKEEVNLNSVPLVNVAKVVSPQCSEVEVEVDWFVVILRPLDVSSTASLLVGKNSEDPLDISSAP